METPTPAPTYIGHRIRARREELGLSRVELAGRAHMAIGYVAHIEDDDTAYPVYECLASLADVLGTTVRDLTKDRDQ